MDAKQLQDRTKSFALRILRLVDGFPTSTSGWAVGRQLVRAGTSIGANYRSACKARSKPDFVSKITIAEEEADESQFWLELALETGLAPAHSIEPLLVEAKELTAIFTASGRTAKAGLRR
jgi:four helix bundle protein